MPGAAVPVTTLAAMDQQGLTPGTCLPALATHCHAPCCAGEVDAHDGRARIRPGGAARSSARLLLGLTRDRGAGRRRRSAHSPHPSELQRWPACIGRRGAQPGAAAARQQVGPRGTRGVGWRCDCGRRQAGEIESQPPTVERRRRRLNLLVHAAGVQARRCTGYTVTRAAHTTNIQTLSS